MFRQLLKGVAVVVGAGVAASVIVSKSLRKQPAPVKIAPEDDLAFQPLLNRLDRIENRITHVEVAHQSFAHADSVSELNSRVEEQSRDLDALHERSIAASHEISSGTASLRKRIEEVTTSLPGLLESIVVARAEDLRLKLRAEVQQSVHGSLASFERAIDEKVSSRISLLEKTMLDHSEAMAELSHRMLEFDVKLQRLMSEIDRVSSREMVKPPARAENISEIKKTGAAA